MMAVSERGCRRALRAAQHWREAQVEHYRRHEGVVVVNRAGDIAGWVNELRDPQHWEPGCRAVALDGTQWLAVGGNDYDGATSWDLVVPAKTESQRAIEEFAKEQQEAALRASEVQKGARHVLS